MTWKKVNQSDAGTASKFSGNDVDKISDAFSGTDVDDIDMNCDFTARDNKLHYRNPANTFSYNVRTSAITANRDVTEPLLTANDTRVYQAHTQTLTNKTADIRDNPLILRENSYLVFKDGSTYYARNGTTGALTSNTAFSTLFQGIINAIPTRDDTIRTKIKIAPGDYDVNTVIDIHDKYNVSIEGSGIGITRIRAGASLGTGEILSVNGSESGSHKSLTTNANRDQKTAVMSSGDASTFAAGDLVMIYSTEAFGPVGGSGGGQKGEIKYISSIAAGTLTFREPLFDTYTTAASAKVVKLLPQKYISFSNFTLGRHPSYNPSLSQNLSWWSMYYNQNISVDKVEVFNFPGQYGGAMYFRKCIDVQVSNCQLNQTMVYNFQYGISFHGCCQNAVVSNCTATGDWRHPFEAGAGDGEGVSRNIKFVNCTATGGSQNCFDTHPAGEGLFFINCGAIGTNDGGGIKIRSKRSGVIGCYVQNCNVTSSGQDAIMLSDGATDCIISNCIVINNSGMDGISLKEVSGDGTMIQGNIIQSNTGDGIHIDNGAGNVSRMGIRDNTVTANGGDGMDLRDFDSGIITGNRISTNGSYGIRFEAATCTNNIVSNNSFSGNGVGAVQNGAQSGNKESNNFGYP